MNAALRVVVMVEFIALWAGFVTFTAGYAWSTGGLIRGGWRRTEAGRLVMALGASCSWVLTLGMVQLVWPDYPGRTVVRLASYAVLVVVVWWMVNLLWRRQRQRRRERRSS